MFWSKILKIGNKVLSFLVHPVWGGLATIVMAVADFIRFAQSGQHSARDFGRPDW